MAYDIWYICQTWDLWWFLWFLKFDAVIPDFVKKNAVLLFLFLLSTQKYLYFYSLLVFNLFLLSMYNRNLKACNGHSILPWIAQIVLLTCYHINNTIILPSDVPPDGKICSRFMKCGVWIAHTKSKSEMFESKIQKKRSKSIRRFYSIPLLSLIEMYYFGSDICNRYLYLKNVNEINPQKLVNYELQPYWVSYIITE